MWDKPEHRLALLELLSRGTLRRRAGQAEAFDALADLPWSRATGRKDEVGVVESRRAELAALLERVWPGWREALAELTEGGLPPTPEGWATVLDRRRAGTLPALPLRLNRRTAAALAAPHSKAGLTEERLLALGETEATHDGTVRLRPPVGLMARTGRGEVDLAAIAEVLGEVSIPERAFLDGLTMHGELRGVLLVENLGAWRDLPAPPGFLLAHVPGWDTTTAAHLLERIPEAPVIHFGDLDPNGVRIYRHLAERRPGLRWLVPDFWGEYLDDFGMRAAWPEDMDLGWAPPLVRKLAAKGLWLEQEAVVLDGRTPAAIEAAAKLCR